MNSLRRPAPAGLLCWGLAFFVCASARAVETQESWDAVFLDNVKIGFIHTFIEPLKENDRDLLRVRVDTTLTFRRGNDTVVNELRYGTIETPEGEVLRLDTRTLASKQEMRTSGDVKDGKMRLTLEGGGQGQQVTIPWGPDVRGPYAAEQSLSRKLIAPGEVRTLKTYIPDLNKVCTITLTAKGVEEIALGDGSKRKLLRIEQTTTLDGAHRSEFDAMMWVDDKGQVLKTTQDILGGMATYRTTREGAEAPNGAAQFDQILKSIVKLPRKLTNAIYSRAIRYKVTLKGDEPGQVFPADRRQSLQPGADKKTAFLNVKTAGPTDGAAGPVGVDPQFLRANALITSDDPLVKSLAKQAVGTAKTPWDQSVAIEKWVFQNMKNKNFETTFAPASEVARDLSGDCTEHSVLSAALCRASGVPARVVVGLVYVDQLGGFGFHMWHEVYVNRRWVALDATFDESAVDAAHIKLAETSLDGVSPYEAFLPIVRVMGKLSIEALESR